MVYYADCLVPMIIICRIACHADGRCRISTYRFSRDAECPRMPICMPPMQNCFAPFYSLCIGSHVCRHSLKYSCSRSKDPKLREFIFAMSLPSVFSELLISDHVGASGSFPRKTGNDVGNTLESSFFQKMSSSHGCCVGGCWLHWRSFPPLRFPYAANT